jgi:hypothetical protein
MDLKRLKIRLTSAQIQKLFSNPVPFIPAPHPGLYINPILWIVRYNAGSVPYSFVGQIQLIWLPDAVTGTSSINITLGTSNVEYGASNLLGGSSPVPVALVDGIGISINANTQNPTLGNGTVDMKLVYSEEPTT